MQLNSADFQQSKALVANAKNKIKNKNIHLRVCDGRCDAHLKQY